MVKTIYFAGNGNVLVFDEDDQQVPEFQAGNLYTAYLISLREKGIDLSGIKIRCADGKYIVVIETDDGLRIAFSDEPNRIVI